MQKLRYIDQDKVTDGTYYQSLVVSQRDDSEPGLMTSDRKTQYYPMEDLQKLEHKRNMEEQKEWNDSQTNEQYMQEQSSVNTAFRRGSLNGSDDWEELHIDQTENRDSITQPQEKQIKLSQVLEGGLYIELQNNCSKCELPIREEELFSMFSQDQADYTVKCPHCQKMFVPKFLVQSEYQTQYVNGREGLHEQLLAPATLYKEFINMLTKKGD